MTNIHSKTLLCQYSDDFLTRSTNAAAFYTSCILLSQGTSESGKGRPLVTYKWRIGVGVEACAEKTEWSQNRRFFCSPLETREMLELPRPLETKSGNKWDDVFQSGAKTTTCLT